MRWPMLVAVGCAQEPTTVVMVDPPAEAQDSATETPEPSCPYAGRYNVVDDNNWITAQIAYDDGCLIVLGTTICELAREEISVAESIGGLWVGLSTGWHDCDGLVVTEEYDVELRFVDLSDSLLLELDGTVPFLNGDMRKVQDLTLELVGP